MENQKTKRNRVLQIGKAAAVMLLSIVILWSCKKNATSTSFTPKPITSVLIAKGHLSNNNVYSKQNIVITNNSQWQNLLSTFNSINSNITNSFTETNIDFNNYVILVSVDVSNSSSSIDIVNVIENQSDVNVTVENIKKGVTTDVAFPYHIVKIPKTTKPIIFQ